MLIPSPSVGVSMKLLILGLIGIIFCLGMVGLLIFF